MIFIVVKHPVRPEYSDDSPLSCRGVCRRYPSRAGNICFDWFRNADDPNLWLSVEAFVDAEARQSHVGLAHFQAAIGSLPKWLAGVPEIVHVEVPGEGWARMSEIEIGSSSADHSLG